MTTHEAKDTEDAAAARLDRSLGAVTLGVLAGAVMVAPALFMDAKTATLFYAATIGGAAGYAVHIIGRRETFEPLPGEVRAAAAMEGEGNGAR